MRSDVFFKQIFFIQMFSSLYSSLVNLQRIEDNLPIAVPINVQEIRI